MTRDRGVSTPLDVALGVLLVGAAVGVIVGIQPAADPGPTVGGSAVIGSQLEVTYQTDDGSATVSGTMGGLLGDATAAGHGNVTARDRAFREAVRATVDERLDTYNRPLQIVGYCRGSPDRNRLVAGRAVPPDRPIRATVYELPAVLGRSDGSPRERTVSARSSRGRDIPSLSARGPVLSAGHSPGTGDRTEQEACAPALVVRRWSR